MDAVTLFAACAFAMQGPQAVPSCDIPHDPLSVSPNARAGAPESGSVPRRLERWQPYIAEAARTFSLPAPWIRAVLGQESGGRTLLNGQPITSPAGAMGLMQIMPKTYDDLRRKFDFGRDAYDPHDNIFAGAAYLREMYDRYGYPSLFAAYNAGPARFDAHLLGGKPLPSATLNYVQRIVPGAEMMLNGGRTDAQNMAGTVQKSASKSQSAPSPETLFFPLSRQNQGARKTANRGIESPKQASRSESIFVDTRAKAVAAEPPRRDILFIPLTANLR